MHRSYRANRHASALAVAILLVPMLAVNSYAQRGNQSDVTGPSVTSSSVVAQTFSVSVSNATRVTTFITPQAANSFQVKTVSVSAALRSQTFTTSTGIRTTPASQNLVYEVGSGGPTSPQAAARLVTILTTGNASTVTITNAEAFVETFRGLLASGVTMNPQSFNALTATQLANTVAAYNAFIGSSSEAYLSAAPPELTTITSVLRKLGSN